MAKKKNKPTFEGTRLVEITRHIAGPPRRSPGQRLWLTAQQIKQQGLAKKDFVYVELSPETFTGQTDAEAGSDAAGD